MNVLRLFDGIVHILKSLKLENKENMNVHADE